jgi:transcriptional regulator
MFTWEERAKRVKELREKGYTYREIAKKMKCLLETYRGF